MLKDVGEHALKIWSLSDEIGRLNETLEAIAKGDFTKKAKVSCVELEDLANTTNTLAETIQKHQESVENYADFLEAGAVRKQMTIEEMERYADRVEAGAAKTHAYTEELKEHANRLESGVAQRTKELAEIGEAVAGMSHCIKNIVNNLRGGSCLIEQGLEASESDLVKKGWTVLGRSITRMSDLALNIVTYSKKRIPDYEDVNINGLINEVIDFVREKATSQDVKILKELDRRIKTIYLEPAGIYRCLLNLASNSIDACEGREESVIYIKSSLIDKENRMRIDISDNGCGMDGETRSKLFTTIFSTKRSKGTGLGLPTTYKIIREHGGTIDVQSELGKGTTFLIHLPIRSDQEGITNLEVRNYDKENTHH